MKILLMIAFFISGLSATDLAKDEKACYDGNAKACYDAGKIYDIKKKDYVKAAELYTKSCDGNYADGCGVLGYMYQDGDGVSKNIQRAAELYTQACDGGDMITCIKLSSLYANGNGVIQSYSKAKELNKKACDRGIAKGCENLKILKDF